MKKRFTLIAVLGLALTGCDRKKPSEAASTTESASITAARSDEDMLRAEISKGLEKNFNTFMLPIGDIEIMSGLSSQMENIDYQRKRFKEDYISYLNDMKAKGLVTFTEKPQSQLDAVRRMGSRVLTVLPTELAKEHRNEELSSANYLVFQIANCEVDDIVRSSPYQSANLSQSEEYRLVLGTYRCTSIPWFRALAPESKDEDYKFRAVLKLNPFTKRYTFQTADWGNSQEDGWMTANVR